MYPVNNYNLKPPCESCNHENLSRDSETCISCNDRIMYSNFVNDPVAFKEANPNFKYSFEKVEVKDKPNKNTKVLNFDQVSDIGKIDKLKICTVCKKEKQLHDFGKNKTKKDGRQTICKQCTKEKRLTSRKKQFIQELKEPSKKINKIKLDIDVRMFPTLKDDLKVIAEKELRTMKAQTLWMLKEAVEQYKKENGL